MAPWEQCKPTTKQTIVPLPFPFNGQLVITSMEQRDQAQADVLLQDQNGKTIKVLTSAVATRT